MQAAPALRADPAARVERQPERGGEVAADDPEPGEQRLVVHVERDEDPEQARVQPLSPSSVMPWTAIAISPASAACSWTESIARRSFGSRETRPAIASPSVTESVISASATSPEARLASHQPYSIGSRPVMPSPRRAVVEHEHAAAVAGASSSARPRRRGPDSSAAFASASASAAVGASAVALTTPVQAGAPVAGSSRWWSARPHSRASTPEVATAPSRERDHGRRFAPERMRDEHLVGAADAHVAAAVDGARAAPSRAAARSATKPLALPPRSSRSPGGRAIVPSSSSTSTSAPGGGGVRPRGRGGAGRRRAPGAAACAARRSASARSPRARARRAASGRRGRRSARRRAARRGPPRAGRRRPARPRAGRR